jgi:hypothetical protein
MERSLAQLHFPHAASLQIRATVVMLNPISRAIVGSDLPAALSSFTLPRSVITSCVSLCRMSSGFMPQG